MAPTIQDLDVLVRTFYEGRGEVVCSRNLLSSYSC